MRNAAISLLFSLWATGNAYIFSPAMVPPLYGPPTSFVISAESPSSISTNLSSAHISTKSVGSNVAFAINVPSSGSSDLYFQITGPTSLSWISLAQGSQMIGANMFIIYANSAGTNVTLSGRLGTGHLQPVNSNESILTLLAGSSIVEGMMTANVKCENCRSWTGGSMSYTSTSTNWIWAYKAGSSLATDSKTASIAKHDAYGATSFDLLASTGGESTNPFLGFSAASISGTTISNGTTVVRPSKDTLQTAHGSIGAVAFVGVFPLGVICLKLLYVPGTIWIHASVQVLGYVLSVASLGTGVYMARNLQKLNEAHSIIGMIVVVCLFLQPALGYAHHSVFKRTESRSMWSFAHSWIGRVFVALGVVNGGLGLRLASSAASFVAAYAVCAGAMGVAWIGVVVWAERRKRMARPGTDGGRAERLGSTREVFVEKSSSG